MPYDLERTGTDLLSYISSDIIGVTDPGTNERQAASSESTSSSRQSERVQYANSPYGHREASMGAGPASGVVNRGTLLFSELLRDVRGIETVTGSNDRHLSAAVKWLFTAQDATDGGGCASVYNLVLGWGGPYPETTGYIIPTLYDYADSTASTEARARAEKMAEWLLTVQFDDGSFPAGDDPSTAEEPSIFNTGQIIFGLVRAYRELEDPRFREAARRAGEWLADVQNEAGYWDRYDYNDVVHSYSARVGWALAEVAELTGADRLRAASANNLQWAAGQRRPNGWFYRCGFEADEDPFLHTTAYTIRGLLEGGVLLDEESVVRAAQASADAFLELQTQGGVLQGRHDESLQSPDFYCLTGNAQMAIVWYRLFEETGDARYRQAADETTEFLKSHQRMDGPLEVRGGLKGSAPVWGPYMYLRYPNWAAKFLADALLLAERLPPA
jgi:hypothetical protein